MAAVADGEGVTTFPVSTSTDGDVLVHVDAEGDRHLLVPGQHSGSQIDGVSLRVAARRLVFDGVERSFLDVSCRQPSLFDVFDELVALVVDAAATATDPVTAALLVIDEWRDLLRTGPGRRLRFEQELGLFAELWVLDQAVLGVVEADWWRGPLREPKDIVFPGGWVEVKGVGVGSAFAHVNGLEQLADIVDNDGHLAVVTLEEDPDGVTLDDLAETLLGRAGQRDLLEERLRVAGWAKSSSDRRWRVDAFDLAEARRCPRIVPDDLREPPGAGVGRIRYDVDLATVRSVASRDPLATLRALTP